MSHFTYDKISQYSDDVVKQIDAKSGKIQAINGKTYTIDRKSGSTFAKFKAAVLKQDYDTATNIVKESQFEILEPPTGKFTKEERRTHKGNTKKGDKWDELGWSEIEKTKFSVKNLTINTQQQEKITLKIIEYVLGSNTKPWKSFAEMYNAPRSEIKKIYKDLPKLPAWWANFELQFKIISKDWSEFPNSRYKVYLYDGKGSFMKYISDLVVKDLNLYSQKDSWNPADIWLVESKKIQNDYIKELNAIADELGKDDKGKYADDEYKSIRDINILLKRAYNKKHIVGISLKKSDGEHLHYTKFNLQAKEKDQKLPNVQFDKIKLDCSYIESSHKFKSKTSQVFVTDNGDDAYKLSYKSNTGEGKIGNITYEFLPSGTAAAQLGKVPKDKLKEWLEDQIKLFNIKGEKLKVEMPQAVNLDTEWSADVEKLWKKKVAIIKKNFGAFTGLDDFVKNLKHSYENGGVSNNNSSMMQMVDFTWILAKLKEQDNFIRFLTLCFYFAQKKGIKYNFGPFGKLY